MSVEFRVTLLGTGNPSPSPDRFGPSTLVEAGGQRLLVDAGRGATIRLWQLGIPLSAINRLLLTHYHSDHTSGVPDLWLTGWLPPVWGSRKSPFRVTGPTGAKTLMTKLEEAYAADIAIRLADEKVPRDGIAVEVQEFDRDGIVYEKEGLKITAFEVDHGDAIKPCYGYRFDYRGRAAVLSSDTRYNENVIRYGTNADLLVHEVMAVRPALLGEPGIQHIMAHHTTPQEAGRVFSRTQPKLGVFTHLVLLASPRVPAMTIDDLVSATRETYDGPLVVGEDLMSFEIGENVTIRRFKAMPGPG
ncbi:MBL fold metallo-hydrolase [Pseudorhodoplanes sinuspersici]|uniref:MBL fold metallo-hydrolase n=1 Tax=Pseudorhodoplanes sinuspersici TaxID=1235591 RepID=A0A1W6ZN43_9HYPH|nr:MBL fold metallo-hydrolase [Pseudorhodoplanes sinuspersici]ARP98560.1 MBL fold metallo-hydrolase [Pseudorhodoplanes sinuspersici]RKE69866.1 ribonuclease Z [Pseudorhodoplanes sinuspersici]